MVPFAVVVGRLLTSLALVVGGFTSSTETTEIDPWYGVDGETAVVHLYFAWSSTCPHCAAAHPFVQELDEKYSWLILHDLQVNGDNAENVALVSELAESIGQEFRYVPTFLYCETMTSGYGGDETTGAMHEARLVECQAQAQASLAAGSPSTTAPAEEAGADDVVSLPIIGDIDPSTMSLPAFTIAVAAFDAFNPCAFFVLLFLLSLLVHARSRGRMAVIGGTFVIISGVVYFAFMVAWLNVFLVFGALPAVTLIAGIVAVTIGAINVKDFFWFQRGPTLSISDEAKPKLFKRMRTLTTSSSFPLILLGTVTLALAANTYELLCTSGFPMVFTRVLTLNDLPTVEYYAYLGLYNVVYVLPLLAIVGVFVWTLGSRKLSERGGRALKLMSGLMMFGLGLVLVFASELLENPLTAPVVMLVALLITGVLVLIDRGRESRSTRPGMPAHS